MIPTVSLSFLEPCTTFFYCQLIPQRIRLVFGTVSIAQRGKKSQKVNSLPDLEMMTISLIGRKELATLIARILRAVARPWLESGSGRSSEYEICRCATRNNASLIFLVFKCNFDTLKPCTEI